MINNKKYVGQSKNVLARWSGHKCDSKIKDLPLYRAMRKYGLDNFQFTILEECDINSLAQREDYWINYYNCFIPNGYNYNKAETHYTNIAIPEKYQQLINDIKYSDKLLKVIAKEYGIKPNEVSRINQGKAWRLENETYPLRGHDEIPLEHIIQLLKDQFTIGEIANYYEVSIPTIKGILYTNNIKVGDIRPALTSSKRIRITNLKDNTIHSFRKKNEAAEWLHNNYNNSITQASYLSAMTYHLKHQTSYKNELLFEYEETQL